MEVEYAAQCVWAFAFYLITLCNKFTQQVTGQRPIRFQEEANFLACRLVNLTISDDKCT